MDRYENNPKHYNTPRPIPQRNKPSIIRTSITKKSSLSNLPNLPITKNISAPNGDHTITLKRGSKSSHRNQAHTTNGHNGHNSNHTSNNTSELQEIVANDFAQISESDEEHEHDNRIHIKYHKTKNRPSTAKTLPHIVDDRKYFKRNNKSKQKRKSTLDRSMLDRNTLDAVQGYRQSMSKGSGSTNPMINNSMSTLTNSNYSNSNNNFMDNGNEYLHQNQNPNHMIQPQPYSLESNARPKKRRKSAECKYVLNQVIEINDPSKLEILYGTVINIQHKRMLIKYHNKQFGQEWFELNDPRINIVKYKIK